MLPLPEGKVTIGTLPPPIRKLARPTNPPVIRAPKLVSDPPCFFGLLDQRRGIRRRLRSFLLEQRDQVIHIG